MPVFSFSDSPQQRHLVQSRPGSAVVRVDDVDVGVAVDASSDGAGRFTVWLEGRSERLDAHACGDTVHVQWRGRVWRIERIDPTRGGNARDDAGAGTLLAPMPGVVVSCQAALGQPVRAGDPVLVIESMKLQTTIGADSDGIVAELPLAVGEIFERGALLARIAASETAR